MKETELNKSNKTKVFILTMLILLVSVAGVSYAYFSVQITGNEEASSMTMRTAKMYIVYNDVQIVSGEYISPGWSDTKTLTVRNAGNVIVKYDLVWRDLYNEITNDELVISATCTSSFGICDDIDETVIPTFTEEVHNEIVKRNIQIEPGVTHTYTVTVEFKETGSNQNYNKNKEFVGTLNIGEYEPSFKIGSLDTITGLRTVIRTVDGKDQEFYILNDVLNYSSLINTNGNIYGYEAGKTMLLAKYNLYVGRIKDGDNYTVILPSAENYGLQSSIVNGYVDSSTPRVGVVPFCGSSTTNGYWYTGSALNPNYGTSYNSSNVYDSTKVTAPDWNYAFSGVSNNENYSVAYYVEEYVDRLSVNATGRLLTYSEANALTVAQRTNGGRYWLGSSNSGTTIRMVGTTGNIAADGFSNATGTTIRPVIIVDTEDIESE